MTIFVVTCSGKYTEVVNGMPQATTDEVELIRAFKDYQSGVDFIKSGQAEPRQPEKWGLRSVETLPVDLVGQ